MIKVLYTYYSYSVSNNLNFIKLLIPRVVHYTLVDVIRSIDN